MTTSNRGFNPVYAEDAPSLQAVSNQAGVTLLEFGTPWCGHCQAAEPAVKEALKAHPTLTHLKVYDGKGRPLGRAFRVKLWPTLILLKAGKEIARLIRPLHADEVRQLITQSDTLSTS